MGLAREAAVTFRKSFHPQIGTKTGNEEDVNNYISVEVKDPDLCTRYCARVVKNIKIEPSPQYKILKINCLINLNDQNRTLTLVWC